MFGIKPLKAKTKIFPTKLSTSRECQKNARPGDIISVTMKQSSSDLYAGVIIDAPLPPLDYIVAEDQHVAVGDRVLVPLGTRKLVGIVVRVSGTTEVLGKKFRKIISVLSDIGPLSDEWLSLTRFASDYYMRYWGEAAVPAMPQFFRKAPGVRYASSLEKLRELKVKKVKSSVVPILNEEQQQAVDAVNGCETFRTFLLYGVTGSGKTEVYLHAMQDALKKNPEGQVLLLVPEINLTPQLEARVRARFTDEVVVTMHSELSQGERARSWLAVHEGRARVLVGTRLAIFASFRKLSLIIVDEEHDASYKAGDGLRYSARDLAVKRARENAVPCVLGSATPSIETWNNVIEKRYECLTLHSRAVAAAHLPEFRVIDTIKSRKTDIFAPEIQEAVTAALARQEQVLVFINRRGYSPVLSCSACGWVSRCMHCSGFTVYHKDERVLVCHHCGARYPVPERCPSCGNPDVLPMGVGTQKIEEALEKLWPQARILRIDRDSVKRKGEAEKAFDSIHAGEVDIVVGTQMIAKGHDFQNVSLVVIANADAQLLSPDMRAEERLFATLVQVSGRAGRAKTPGTVMVQTWFASHPIYEDLKHQDYGRFAARLLNDRREACLPPFMFQALITAEAATLDKAIGYLRALAAMASEVSEETDTPDVWVYDAVPMSLMRLMDRERAQLLIESGSRASLHRFLVGLCNRPRPSDANFSGLTWTIEVDPASL